MLGPKGYGGVQISPPQENIAMVQACHAAGVKIYADAVINHTAGTWPSDTRGSAGSSFTHYDYLCGQGIECGSWPRGWLTWP